MSVRPINKEILGMESGDNLISQIFPAIGTINTAAFRPGDRKNDLLFSFAPQNTGRIGIFAAGKNNVERAVIMCLPKVQADGVLICITQGFGQADSKGALTKLGWSNPLSPEFVKFALLKHVINRWGVQMLASRKNLALMYILRAQGNELGPFARDGAFVVEVLDEIRSLTKDSFSYNTAEAFTFSSGIADYNNFMAATSSHLNFKAAYSIDPAGSLPGAKPPNGVIKQYASGTAAGFLPGFEPMPIERWKNEDEFPRHKTDGDFEYLHNHCMPRYCLYLGLQTT
jgi:hypothetical protein